MVLREDFFEDLYSRRPHQPEEAHSEADEVLLFPSEDSSISVSFGDITTETKMAAEKIREEPDYACHGDYRLASRAEIISIFASFISGGSLYILCALFIMYAYKALPARFVCRCGINGSCMGQLPQHVVTPWTW